MNMDEEGEIPQTLTDVRSFLDNYGFGGIEVENVITRIIEMPMGCKYTVYKSKGEEYVILKEGPNRYFISAEGDHVNDFLVDHGMCIKLTLGMMTLGTLCVLLGFGLFET